MEYGSLRIQLVFNRPPRREAAIEWHLAKDEVVPAGDWAKRFDQWPLPEGAVKQVRWMHRAGRVGAHEIDPVGMGVKVLHRVQELAKPVCCHHGVRGSGIQVVNGISISAADVLD